MTDDPGIVCFQHCAASKIFCYRLPECCPSCTAPLGVAADLMPFRLPYPFVRPHQHPCAVMLKPTCGDFMNDYFNSMDLHIGVTTSNGTIVEFDQRGLRHTPTPTASPSTGTDPHSNPTSVSGRSSPDWSQSLLVADAAPDAWHEHWDAVLDTVCTQPDTWTPRRYEAQTHNCYAFVLEFLQRLDYGALSRAAHNRTLFCERFIVPRTTAAGKYISLYRKLRDADYYVHELWRSSATAPAVVAGKTMLLDVAEPDGDAERPVFN